VCDSTGVPWEGRSEANGKYSRHLQATPLNPTPVSCDSRGAATSQVRKASISVLLMAVN